MAPVSLRRVMKATFSAQDVAYALQLPGFTNFQREVSRAGGTLLARKRTRSGGYRYAHIVELAFHLALDSKFGRDPAKSIFWGLCDALNGNDTGLKKINALPQAEREVIFHGSDFEEDDFPIGAPKGLSQIAEFPQYFFDEDLISRDVEKPTLFTFDPAPMPGARADVLIVEDMPVSQLRQRLLNQMLRHAASRNAEELFREQSEAFLVIDLTAMLSRLDLRLKLRLEAQQMRGEVDEDDEEAAAEATDAASE